MNVTKIILTKCQIFLLKCTKFNFDWGSTLSPTGELIVLPELLTEFWGRGGKRKGRGRRMGRVKGMVRGEEEKGNLSPLQFSVRPRSVHITA